MPPVFATAWQGPAPCRPGRPRLDAVASARGVVGAEWRGGAVGPTAVCIFLFFRSRKPAHWVARRAHPFDAAMHKPLVNINENTSANTSARTARADRSQAGTHWASARKWPARTARAVQHRREKNKPITSQQQAGTRSHGTRARPGRESGRRGPPRWLAGSEAAARCRGLGACGSSMVGACRSLLIHRLRPPAEPVRSGGSRGPRHGQRAPCRPPSPLTESGGRP
jgi:hypothetical protein